MPSPNFEFLAPSFPLLAQYATTAEAYVERDPNAALVKLRQFGEVLAREISECAGLYLDSQSGQHDRLKELGKAGLLPRRIGDQLHAIRKEGNSAVHGGTGTCEQAAALVRDAAEVARWFRAKFAPSLPEPADRYIPILRSADNIERLRTEIEELRRLVSERAAVDETGPSMDLVAELERLLVPHESRYTEELGAVRAELEELRAMHAASDRAAADVERTARSNGQSVASSVAAPSAALSAPVCPIADCGAVMELTIASRAVAKKGVAVGDPIWRCSRSPDCKGWRQHEDGANQLPAVDATWHTVFTAAPGNPAIPRRRAWTEYGIRDGWEVTYLNCGGRLRSLDIGDQLSDGEKHALSQTAVFVSAVPDDAAADEHVRLVASVVRRILGRGVLPPVDPAIEEHLLSATGLMAHAKPARHPGDLSRVLDRSAPLPNAAQVTSAIRHREAFVPYLGGRQPDGSNLLHEDAELPFFRDWIGHLGNTAGHWWHPQASLETMLQAASASARRVDFLCATPDGAVAVEIDGRQHIDTVEVDAARDDALRRAGIDVVRVPAADVLRDDSKVLSMLHDRFSSANADVPDRATLLFTWGPVVAHRIALGITEALDRGWLRDAQWQLVIDEPLGIAVPAVRAAVETIAAVAAAWHAPAIPESVLVRCGDATHLLRSNHSGSFELSVADGAIDALDDYVHVTVQPFHGPYHTLPRTTGRQVVLRSTYLPVHLVDERPFGGVRSLAESAVSIPSWSLHRLLRGVFAKREFQPEGPEPRGQEVALRRVLAGQDAVVLLPTGAGKSLIYQLAGLLTPGLTLVIDPIVALIEDQIDGLRRQGIDRAVGISSADTKAGNAEEKLAQIHSGDAMFVFVAPERMQQQRFRDALRTMSVSIPINLLVVDEAHCVSEWGHDFRTSYLDIGRVLRHVAADQDGIPPPVLALTGTASRAVLKDMLIELSVDRADPDVVISPAHFDRPELRYVVVKTEDDNLVNRLVGTIKGLPSMFTGGRVPRTSRDFLRPRGDESACGIVFCQTVNGPRGVAAIARDLSSALQIEAPIYAGSAPKNWGPASGGFDGVKRRNAERFKNSDTTLLVATKSYGMGIDKPNVRYIVHAGIPSSIEGYYQEAGRAGRDQRESVCVIVHDPSSRDTLDWFHNNSFVGADEELRVLTYVVDHVGPTVDPRKAAVPFGKDEKDKVRRERAIHRLKLLGLVTDYTVDWSARHYDVRLKPVMPDDVDNALINFVRRNQPGRVPDFERRVREDAPIAIRDRILSRARLMIEYVYDTIVASRRRAVDEMERLANEGRSDAIIRDRILRYLELGRVSGEVEELLDREPFHFREWMALLDALDTSDDAREWRGATTRMLESDPDNPGLLLGRGLAEAVALSGDATLFVESLTNALRSAASGYSVEATELAEVVVWLSRWLGRRRLEWRALVYPIVERALPAPASFILEPLEADALGKSVSAHGELAVVLARRLRRANDRIRRLTTTFEEIA